MAYIVTTNIIDTKDNNRLYEKGEVYPREDLSVTDARIKALLKKGLSNQMVKQEILFYLLMNQLKKLKKWHQGSSSWKVPNLKK